MFLFATIVAVQKEERPFHMVSEFYYWILIEKTFNMLLYIELALLIYKD